LTSPCKRWPCRPLSLHKFARRKSTIAFWMALPLIVAVACLVIYPAFYSMHLATLNKSMTKFVGVGNFEECGGIGDRTVNFLPREDAVRRRARHETSAGVQLGPSWVDRGCRSVPKAADGP